MMFALGIIDTLTPGELNGGENVAGTGHDRRRRHGRPDRRHPPEDVGRGRCRRGLVPRARRRTATRSSATSRTDCSVFSVETLDDALDVLEAIRDDGDLAALPTCDAAEAARFAHSGTHGGVRPLHGDRPEPRA